MKMISAAAVLLALFVCLRPATAAVPAAVDGHAGDWEAVPPAVCDAAGDGARIDIRCVWITTDAERVTLRFEVEPEINLQNGNRIKVLLDGDGDATTGWPTQGLGAEVSWTFGQREGTLWREGRSRSLGQADVGLLQAPTVSSREFEVSLRRRLDDGTQIVPGPKASLVLIDEGGASGDRVPDGAPLTFAVSDAPAPAPLPVSIERRDPGDVRILTWNVLFDGLFKRPAPFIRVLRAVDPDVICFQEVWSHTARDAADQVSLAIPGATWHGESTTDGLIVSRYPIVRSRAIDEAGNYWALIDLPDDRYATDLSVVSAHPACCDKEKQRQDELDGIAAWLRELATPGGDDVPTGTPVVVAGDMNLVGGASQVGTLLAGAIADEESFGPSHAADWDGSPLADAEPRHAGGRDTFTWRDARSSYSPGRLDYIVYSDSVAALGNSFVLATEELDAGTLERLGLRAGDTLDASDHLPVVADLRIDGGRARAGTAE